MANRSSEGMTFDVDQIKKDFPILDRTVNGKRLVFLDSAASSQKPSMVIDGMSNYYETTHANVHRGVYTLAEEATNAYEGARKKIAKFINAPDPATVLFSKNVTESMNLLARSWGGANLGPGDAVVLTVMEHHANIVPWQIMSAEKGFEIRYIDIDSNGELDLANLDQLLDGAKLLSITGVGNVLGTINPVDTLVARAHSAGALVALDLAQWVPHLATDVVALDADFVAFTGHKMLGPTGIGVLWAKRELLEAMPPFLGGGDMILNVTLEGFVPNELPWKFEAGTPPVAEAIGLGLAVDYLTQLGMDSVRAHERALTGYALETLTARFGDKLTIHGPQSADQRGGVISMALAGVHPHDVSQILNEHGVCVRAGHHCAKPLMQRLGETATARASFYVYNDEADVDALTDALAHAFDFFS